jgi:hypothetical protein
LPELIVVNRISLPWLALWVLLLVTPEAGRASGIVTNCTESDLRVALRGGGFVVLACDSAISLTSPLLIGKETVLDATGHTASITSAQTTNTGSLFVVQPGANLILRNLTVSGVQLVKTNSTNGDDGTAALGAALYIDRGVVTLDGCTFVNHDVTGGAGADGVKLGATGGNGGPGAGAAVYNSGGQLLVTNCVFSGNSATGGRGGAGAAGQANGNGASGGHGGNGGSGSGGAIFNTANGLLTVFDSTFASNQVAGSSAGLGGLGAGGLGFSGTAGDSGGGLGAALYNDSGQVTIINSTFVANSGTGARGSAGAAGTSSMQPGRGTTGGSALGAGLFNNAGSVALTNCTFVSNSLTGGSGGQGGTGITFGFGGDGGSGGNGGDALGAGVYTSRGTTVIVNSTFTDNGVFGGGAGQGGAGSGIGSEGASGRQGNQVGAALFNAGGVSELRNSILANSASGANAGGTISDEGFNISSDASPRLSAEGSRNQLDPLLGSFGLAGGLVPTITLASNSPAIDAITAPAGNGAPPFDQRGAMRVEPYDIGAFEFDGTFTVPSLQAQLVTNQVVLSWPAIGNFALQTTPTLSTNNLWLTLTNQPSSASGMRTLTVTSTNQASFYRLAAP